LGWVGVLAVAVMVIAIVGFFNHDAFAVSFDIKDQASCQSLSSGSPSTMDFFVWEFKNPGGTR